MPFSRRFLRLSLYIFSIAYLLNLAWEFGHAPLYVAAFDIYSHLPIAAVGDGIAILAIYLVVAIVRRNFLWIKGFGVIELFLVLVLGAAFASFNEIINVFYLGRWAYTAAMPLLPGGLGLTPILQMLLLPLLSFWIAGRLIK